MLEKLMKKFEKSKLFTLHKINNKLEGELKMTYGKVP